MFTCPQIAACRQEEPRVFRRGLDEDPGPSARLASDYALLSMHNGLVSAPWGPCRRAESSHPTHLGFFATMSHPRAMVGELHREHTASQFY